MAINPGNLEIVNLGKKNWNLRNVEKLGKTCIFVGKSWKNLDFCFILIFNNFAGWPGNLEYEKYCEKKNLELSTKIMKKPEHFFIFNIIQF